MVYSDEENGMDPAEKDKLKVRYWPYFERGAHSHKSSSSREAFCRACVDKTGNRVPIRGDSSSMWNHISSCKNFNKEEKAKLKAEKDERDRELKKETKQRSRGGKRKATDDSQASKRSTVASFMESSMTMAESEKSHALMLRAFVTGNVPFVFAENLQFREFLKSLRITYNPPCRQDLSGEVLKSEVTKAEISIAKALNGQNFLTLTFDGWKIVNSCKILGFTVILRQSSSTESFLIALEEVTAQSYTAEDVIFEVEKQMDYLRDKHQALVKCVTMDSDGAHIKARRLLAIKYPEIVFLPCLAHQVNLIIKHIFDVAKFGEVCKSAISIVSYFNKHNQLKGRLEEQQKVLYNGSTIKLLTPTETRWNSFSRSFDAVLRSKCAIQSLVTQIMSDGKSKCEIAVVVENDNFWIGLKAVHNLMKPIIVAQAVAESDKCTLSDVLVQMKEIFHAFKAYPDSVISAQIVSDLEARWKKFFNPRLMIIALALNPAYKLRLFVQGSVTWTDIVSWCAELYKAWFKEIPVNLVGAMAKYKSGERPFEECSYEGFVSEPLHYWKFLMDDEPEIASLARVAIHVIQICPQAAGNDRVRSIVDGIHTKKRNRLMLDKVKGSALLKLHILQEERLEKEREDQRRKKRLEKNMGNTSESQANGDIEEVAEKEAGGIMDSQIEKSLSADYEEEDADVMDLIFEHLSMKEPDEEIELDSSRFITLQQLFGNPLGNDDAI